jgi:hypothetical protein
MLFLFSGIWHLAFKFSVYGGKENNGVIADITSSIWMKLHPLFMASSNE